MRQCLIITATIQPNSVMVAQNDVQVRKEEYLKALQFYIQHYQSPIYFIENSNFNFKEDADFQAIFGTRKVNLIQYPSSTEFEKGKGYQEFEILDQTIQKLTNEFDEFIKVSGRYIVTNFDEFKAQKNNGIVMDRHKKRKVAITSFFSCRFKEYHDYIAGSYKDVNDAAGIFIEHVVYQRLKNINPTKIDLLVKNPVYEGVSGSYGGSLNRHPLKMKMTNVERKFLKLIGKKEFELHY